MRAREADHTGYVEHDGVKIAYEVVGDGEPAVLVTHCGSTAWGFTLAAEHPDRVLGVAAVAPGIPYVGPPHPHWVAVRDGCGHRVEAAHGLRVVR